MLKTVAIALLAAVAFAEPEAKPKADADPYLLYGGYGLGHLAYGGYYGHGLGYTTYYGKCEAEAEPKAAADPYLLRRILWTWSWIWILWSWIPWSWIQSFMESALLMPSQKLTPTFCMEDIDTLDMPDTMDTPMVDMPTMDKLLPLISKWTANHPCFLYQ